MPTEKLRNHFGASLVRNMDHLQLFDSRNFINGSLCCAADADGGKFQFAGIGLCLFDQILHAFPWRIALNNNSQLWLGGANDQLKAGKGLKGHFLHLRDAN